MEAFLNKTHAVRSTKACHLECARGLGDLKKKGGGDKGDVFTSTSSRNCKQTVI